MIVNWANDGLLQAYDSKMLVNDGEMLIYDGEMLLNDGKMSLRYYTNFPDSISSHYIWSPVDWKDLNFFLIFLTRLAYAIKVCGLFIKFPLISWAPDLYYYPIPHNYIIIE